jgi:hypothetical protein
VYTNNNKPATARKPAVRTAWLTFYPLIQPLQLMIHALTDGGLGEYRDQHRRTRDDGVAHDGYPCAGPPNDAVPITNPAAAFIKGPRLRLRRRVSVGSAGSAMPATW